MIPMMDNVLNQRAYVCHVCAMQFKLSPFTMAKSSCFICANMIIGGNAAVGLKYEARLCQKHGSPGYPNVVQCVVCRMVQQKPKGPAPGVFDPVPLNICFECWASGSGSRSRCCWLNID